MTATATLVAHLEAARGDAARPERALESLLAAWRLQPAPAIADAIAELAPRLPDLPHPIARRKHWQGVLAAGRAVDVAGLVAALDSAWAPTALVQLVDIPADPRTTVALAARLHLAPEADRQRLLARLVALADPRTVDAVVAQLGDAPSTRAMRAAAAAAATLAPAVATALDRYRAARAAHLAAERVLLDAVYASPDDDGPRLVYGDWLQDQQDPRGDFIALQFRRHRGRMSEPERDRERTLFTAYRRAWLDGLDDPAVEPRSYRRGFVDEVAVGTSFGQWPAEQALASPAWATVRTLELTYSSQYGVVDLVGRPALRGLRSLINVEAAIYADLLASPTALGLDHLTVRDVHGWREPEAWTPVGPGLASVTSLAVTGPFRWLPGSPLLGQLRSLRITLRWPQREVAWLTTVLARARHVDRIVVETESLTVTMVAGARRLSRLEVTPHVVVMRIAPRHVTHELVPLVSALRGDAITELVIVAPGTEDLGPALAPLRAQQRELASITYQADR